MKELGREPEAGLARARRADHTGVQVPGIGRDFRAGVHGEKFRSRQNDVVLEFRVNEWFNVLRRAPPGGAVLGVPAEFLFLLDFGLDKEVHPGGSGNPYKQVKAAKPRPVGFKGHREGVHHPHELCAEVRAGGDTVGRPQL